LFFKRPGENSKKEIYRAEMLCFCAMERTPKSKCMPDHGAHKIPIFKPQTYKTQQSHNITGGTL
jgi:hypothetical protein